MTSLVWGFLKRLGSWQLLLTAIATPFFFYLQAGGDPLVWFTPVGALILVLIAVPSAFMVLPLSLLGALLHTVALFQRDRRTRQLADAEVSP